MTSSAPSYLTIVIALIIPGVARSEPDQLAIAIHYTDGLTSGSTEDEIPQIVLHSDEAHIHVRISNLAETEITLWRPNCPWGDDAVRFEFREPDHPDAVVESRTSHDYTAGMGWPKTLPLAPGDDLILNVAFLSFWNFPVVIPSRESRELEMRMVYESRHMNEDGFMKKSVEAWYEQQEGRFKKPDLDSVWTGRIETPWETVRIINRTDETTGLDSYGERLQ